MAKKRWEFIDLFGKRFQLDTKETIGYAPISDDGIYDVYARPSATKVSIWNSWETWFRENNGWCGISSHNSNFFSIQGYVRNYETREMWFCWITPSHNYCIVVDEQLD